MSDETKVNSLPDPPDEIPLVPVEPQEVPAEFKPEMVIHVHNELPKEKWDQLCERRNKALLNLEAESLRIMDAYEQTGLASIDKLRLYKESCVEIPSQDIYLRLEDKVGEIHSAINHYRNMIQKVVAGELTLRKLADQEMFVLNNLPYATVVFDNEDVCTAYEYVTNNLKTIGEEVEKLWKEAEEKRRQENPECESMPLGSFDIILRNKPDTFIIASKKYNCGKYEWEMAFKGRRFFTKEYKLYWPDSLNDLKEKIANAPTKQKNDDDTYQFVSFILKIKMSADQIDESANVDASIKTYFKGLKKQFDLRLVEPGEVFTISLPSNFLSDKDAFTRITNAAHEIMPGCVMQCVLTGPNGVTFYNTADKKEVRVSKGAVRPYHDPHED